MGWKAALNGKRFVCSWSGGKDSCLALWRAMKTGQPVKLFTMLEETGECSRSHALPPLFLHKQAEALGIPHETRSATWGGYEAKFIAALQQFQQDGAEAAVFGDIDLEAHGLWEEKVCGEAGLSVHLPLWQESRRALVEEFLDLGFRAVIVVINETLMDPRYLGRELSRALLAELERDGVDLCGENGEYHTAVLDGPIFRQPVPVKGTQWLRHDGYSFLMLDV